MVKLNRIYTRTGDDGETGLVDGSRVAKPSARIEAIGTVDEANSAIGVALTVLNPADPAAAMLGRVQNELFDLGADLATPYEPGEAEGAALRVLPGQVERLEREIDALNAALSPLTSFLLPGGAAAHLHVARATVRRAERHAVAAKDDGRGINPVALRYLNRLSDHLFTLCRTVNAATGDILWQPGATR